ncbi:MAG: cation transporter [Clostridia bacterium]|nr:cation transporter [Clostridia bacterium]
MKTEKNIFVAFLLNLAFSIFEFVGGIITGSVAIVSDAIHDLGDATSIGISYILEKKSKRQPDDRYTYGYLRYSVLGGMITTLILLLGSIFVIINAIERIITPVSINYDGMIIFAIVGVIVNFIAAHLTREGDSINQKSVNLHMLEDVLGWVVVLVGAIVMKFTDISIIDPIMSILVALFILKNAVCQLGEVLKLFLVKTPSGIEIDEVKEHLLEIDGVVDVRHIHIWSMDGVRNYATMHVVTDMETQLIKREIREELAEHGISHVTIETEKVGEDCYMENCHIEHIERAHHHHHHH